MKGTKGLDERIGSWIQPIQPQPIAVGVYWLPWTFGKKWDATFAAAQLEMKFSSFHSALIPATSCARWSPRDTPLISRDKSTEELRRYGCAAESLASDLGRCLKNLKDLKVRPCPWKSHQMISLQSEFLCRKGKPSLCTTAHGRRKGIWR